MEEATTRQSAGKVERVSILSLNDELVKAIDVLNVALENLTGVLEPVLETLPEEEDLAIVDSHPRDRQPSQLALEFEVAIRRLQNTTGNVNRITRRVQL